MPFNCHHDPRPSPSSSSSSRPSLTSSESTEPSSPELSSPLQQLSIADVAVKFKQPPSLLQFADSFDLVREEEEQMKHKADRRDENRAGPEGVHHVAHRPAHSRTSSKTFTSRVERPVLPPRQISFSKRHASFDSPAEIPFPTPLYHPQRTPSIPPATHSRTSSRVVSSAEHPGSPIAASSTASASNPLSYRSGAQRDSYFPLGLVDGSLSDSSSSSSSSSNSSSSTTSLPSARAPPKHLRPPLKTSDSNASAEMMTAPSHPPSVAGKGRDQGEYFAQPPAVHVEDPSQPKQSTSAPSSAPITPFSRPYSTSNVTDAYGGKIYSPTPLKPWDRSSTASLPLPSQTPFFTLPTVEQVGDVREEPEPRTEDTRAASPPMFDSTSASPSPSPSPAPAPPALMRASTSASVASAPAMPTARSAVSPATLPRAAGTPLSVASSSSIPPPAPPTILTPPPPPLSPESMDSTSRRPAPYEPFLSHAPPPGDSWIAVETSQREYRLIVRLPGFRRDGM